MGNQLNAINLEAFGEDDLNELEKRLRQERQRRDRNRIKDAQKEMREVASKYGMSPEEILGGAPARKSGGRGGKVPPKYRHPEDAGKTWTGRGRAPKWVEEWEKSGRSRDELLIKD